MSPKEKALVEVPKAEMSLVKGKGSMSWYSYKYTTKDVPLIIADYQETYKVQPKRGHLMVIENKGELNPYITKSGHACIANYAKISTKPKVENITRKGSFLSAMVYCEAILPDGTSHGAIGYSDNTETGRDKLNKCISMATTRARNAAIDVAMEIQTTPFEDFDRSDEMKKRAMDITDLQNEVLIICSVCKKKGWSRLEKKCTLCKITYEEIVAQK